MSEKHVVSNPAVNTKNGAVPLRRSTAILLLIEFLLIFLPLIILGAAINWPASLDEPASAHGKFVLVFCLRRGGFPIGENRTQ